MAGKLTQDEIKWILSIDAHGVQKEIAVTSSEINKLTDANKLMNSEMKAAEKQMTVAAKEMEKLAKAGKGYSKEFMEAKATSEAARYEMESYTLKIADNNQAISENKNKLEELNKSLGLNEMTMKQLRQRAAELQKQLAVTSSSANPKEYKALQDQLEKVNTRIFDVNNQGKGLIQQFAAMNNPIGSAAQSVLGFGQALKALIANPVGIIIMAIVAAFYALKTAIMGSDEATTKYEGVMAAFNSILDNGKRILTEFVALLINFITLDFSGMKENINNLADMGEQMVDNAKAAYDAAIAEDALNDSIARNNDITEVNKARIAELTEIARDTTKSVKERKAASEELMRLEKDNYKMAVSNISGQYEVWKGKNKNLIDAMRRGSDTQFAEVEKYMIMVQEGTELTYQQRLELARLVNDITATLDRGTEEEKEKFRSFFSEMSTMQKDYFDGNRRNTLNDSRIDKEARQEAANAAKQALEKRIEQTEMALQKETNILKQRLADRLITQEQYDKLLEQKTIESLNKKLAIAGLDAKQRLDIEQQLLDFKIKAIELEKKLTVERETLAASVRKSIMDANSREIEEIKEKYAKRLDELKKSLDKEAVTELEYNAYKEIILEEQTAEIEEKRKAQREAAAAKKLADQNTEYENEKMALLEQYADGLLTRQDYNNLLLKLDEEYALRSLEISNLSDKEKIAARKKLLEMMVVQNEAETKKQEDEQKKRVALYSQFGEQIGTMMGGVISANEDIVKSSLKAIINMALDALEAQVQMAIVGVTVQGLSSLNPAMMAVALAKTVAIKALFAGVKTVVNGALSGSSSSPSSSTSSSPSSGQRVLTGKKSGGYIDVSRAQDGKYFRALLNPKKRGFIDKPTVIVGDGPEGSSQEWVASNDALQNPTIAPFIQLLESARQAGTIRTIDLNQIMRSRMAGFASGGFLYNNPLAETMRSSGSKDGSLYKDKKGNIDPEIVEVFRQTRDLLASLKNDGVKAPIVLSELQRIQELQRTSQQIGSKR